MDKLIKRNGEFVYLTIAEKLSKEKQEIESSKEVLERLSEGAIDLNDNEVFHNCSYSCYLNIADALNKLKAYEDAEIRKNKVCCACNGSGWYDSMDSHGNNMKCDACDGTGYEG